MGIGKQAKILNRSQVDAVLNHISARRYGLHISAVNPGRTSGQGDCCFAVVNDRRG